MGKSDNEGNAASGANPAASGANPAASGANPAAGGAGEPAEDRAAAGGGAPSADSPPRASARRRRYTLRGEIHFVESLLWGAACIGAVFLIWFLVTAGEYEDRIVKATKLPSPRETFRKFHALWFQHALTRNSVASVWRVVAGFSLASLVGIPLGVACGCSARIRAWFAPLVIFGRNIPMAALIPLTIMLFGIGQQQKMMFLFLAAVAFVVADTTQSILDVDQKYVDTAYTLGASRRQVIFKVLFPLALPSILNSLRLLFGLAFGYIMLAEVIRLSGDDIGQMPGLGGLINTFERRSDLASVYLILLVIPLLAFGIDRLLFWLQRQLLPHVYGGPGWLSRTWKALWRWDWEEALEVRREASGGWLYRALKNFWPR